MQKVYRPHAEWGTEAESHSREPDHMKHLISSLIHTRDGNDENQLTGIEWKTKDGKSNGGVDTSGTPYGASAAASSINILQKMLSETIIPKQQCLSNKSRA